MGFETVVLGKVAEFVGSTRQAEFTNGTLFVGDITPVEAVQIAQQLQEIVRCKIGVNSVGSEFAFDFI